ncbi:MAG: HAD family hydrolase, partial [Gemmatimonadetes bacterium]|nr:HAD family hydrolase [Gemmatimonadota bacterium]
PVLIERALADFGCGAGESIFVGDTGVDVHAGRAAGLYTIAVLGGFRDESEVRAAGPDRVVGRLDETIAFLP